MENLIVPDKEMTAKAAVARLIRDGDSFVFANLVLNLVSRNG